MSTAQKILDYLRSFDLKEESNGKYRCNSPLRAGSNSHAFAVTIEGDEHGAYFDHVAGEGGTLYDLAQKIGIEVPKKITLPSTKRVYTGIEDYAKAHGIEGEQLARAGWTECTYQNRRALQFTTATGKRWRFLDGEKPVYISEKGYTRCWYALNTALMKKLADGQPLIICNGEASTIAGRVRGLAATCVTGGENAIPVELMNQLWSFLGDLKPNIIIALDCDAKGRQTAKQMESQLKAVNFDVKAVDLGLGKGGDLADFCLLHDENVATSIVGLPTIGDLDPHEVSPRRWRIIHARELAHLPPIEWIIEGEIPARGITVLYGTSGAGKSFFGLDCALKVAQTDPVIYMAGEGEYGYRQRVAAWCKHHGKDEGKLYMCLGAVSLLETDDLQAFLDSCAPLQPRMVVVDTLARSMVGADENSSRDMGYFIRACEDIKQALGCAVVIIHHTNKQGIVERGSGSLRGASDSMISLSTSDDIIVVESTKTKDAQPFPTRYMKLLEISIDVDGQPLNSAVIIPGEKVISLDTDRLTIIQRKVLDVLLLEIFQSGATRSDIEDNTQIPTGSLSRAMSTLLKRGYVTQAAAYSPYQITEAGRGKIESVESVESPTSDSTTTKSTNDSIDSTDSTDSISTFEDYAKEDYGVEVTELPGFESDPPNQYDYGA